MTTPLDPRAIMLVDPSLFTQPYDAALSCGLEQAGAHVRWATRALRAEEEDVLGAPRVLPLFYPFTDGPNRRAGNVWRAVKGAEHAVGLIQLAQAVARGRFDLVHFQWSVLPRLDRLAIRRLRRDRPIVLTVHDSTPFNGKNVARVQLDGQGTMPREVDRVIVHTESAAESLIRMGVDRARTSVVPHGLLPSNATARRHHHRWRIVQFGKLQDYKGADVLIEALGLLTAGERARLRVIIAGEALIDPGPLRERARALGLDDELVSFDLRRLPAVDMDELLGDADAFVFPYRAIEASGVLFQVAALGRWVIASDLGAFSGLIGDADDAGTLVPAGNPRALAAALMSSIGREPTRSLAADVPGWHEIGLMTRDVYRRAASDWAHAA